MKNFFVLALSLVSLNLFAQPFGWNRGFVIFIVARILLITKN
jgi:hypothetical protein